MDRLPEPSDYGDHIRFYTDVPSGTACAGTLPYLDRYVGELKSRFGALDDVKIDYFLFGDSERSSDYCESSTACTYDNGVVVTSLFPHEHELVHAVHAKSQGFAHPFLEEGLAEVWGNHNDRKGGLVGSVVDGIRAGADQESVSTAWYGTAGLFVSYLVYEFGADVLLEIGRRAPLGSSVDAVDDAFVSELGVNVEGIVAEFENSDWACERSRFRDDTLNCAIAPRVNCDLAEADGSIAIVLDTGCASSGTIGPREGVVWTEIAFALPSSRFLRASYTGPAVEPAAGLVLRSCVSGCEDDRFLVPPGPNHEWLLEPGDYLLRLEVPFEAASQHSGVLRLENLCGD